MEFHDDAMPPVELLQRMAECCEEIEDAVRFGLGFPRDSHADFDVCSAANRDGFWERFSIEPYVHRFDEEYRPVVREEFEELIRELRGGTKRPTGEEEEESEGGDSVEHIKRYEVIEKLAEGGMGRISIAWDREFSRRVAIKSIQPQVLSTREVRERFEQEAQITAKLEHPGILPVYSRGKAMDGSPYYAMRLIVGGNASSMHRAIHELHDSNWSEREFNRRQRVLLRHVINVCNTIGYAHDRGVCHRDLKPSNVLIGPFGETFVVDWGLAKVFREVRGGSYGSKVESEDCNASTEQAFVPISGRARSDGGSVGSKSSVAGTPGYRAPENMGYEVELDWPKVDVYSIGAILHCIVYGRSPSKSQSIQALAIKDDDYFRRLRTSWGKGLVVSSKLLAISSKAMHADQSNRYSSVLALANDLESYLSGEPISVRVEGVVERGVRWIGKHRHWALAGLAATISLVGAAVTVAVLQSTHNRDLKIASVSLQRALESEELYRIQEGRLRELAERKERAARDREGLAIDALRSYCEAIYRNDVLKNSSSLLALRKQLLEEPLHFFEEIAQGSVDVKDSSFFYLQRLAQTSEELAKLSFEYGDYGQCERWVMRSIECYENLERKLQEDSMTSGDSTTPKTVDLLRNAIGHADSYRLQGTIRILRGDRAGARESLEIAEHLLQSATDIEGRLSDDKHPEELVLLYDKRAEFYALFAIFEAEGGDVSKVMPYFESAVQAKERVVRIVTEANDGPEVRSELRKRAATRSLLDLKQDRAHVYLIRGLGNRDASIKQFQNYIEMLRESLVGTGASESEKLRLAWALHNLGGHNRQSGAMEDALGCLEEALQLRKELVATYPSVIRYRADMSRTLSDLAYVQIQVGQKDEGVLSMQTSLDGLRRLGQDVPESSYGLDAIMQKHQWGHYCIEMGMKDLGEGAFTEALVEFEEALSADSAIVSVDRNPGLRALYLELMEHRAEILKSQSQSLKELELRRRMVRIATESSLEEIKGELWKLHLGLASAALRADISNGKEFSSTALVHQQEVLEALRVCSKELVKRREELGVDSSAWQMIRAEVQQQLFGSAIFEQLRSTWLLEQLEAEERSEWEALWSELRIVD